MVYLSVCVPAYNSARTLEETLRSILGQDAEMEVVVLDNASRDETTTIAASFDDGRVRFLRDEERLPIGEHWNKVVSLSTGKLVKMVCPGDILLPGAIAAQSTVMGDRGIAIASSRFEVIDANGVVEQTGLGLPRLIGAHDARTLMRVIVRRGPVDFGPTATAIFRRVDFDRVGGFRGDLVLPMDVDLIARLCAFGSFYGMPEITAAWRNSSFVRCDSTATVGRFTEMLRFHHRLGGEYPNLVGHADVITGDLRLARAALERLRALAVETATHRIAPTR
ncbi:glycosyltransferase [Nocardia uniformis]|uniref:Glycosyltransferase n=1 Tax=Nocardia uniformis TaxID=53432 RepID=A0A849C016_9NOCA|nr:glycosyltransferase [Nocardia uniformis]NNH70776.1 glycosyltransferase [Nocardia uniformis]